MRLLTAVIIVFLLLTASVRGQNFEETRQLAEQGNADAQLRLGLMYANGKGVPENDAEAVKWYHKAAEQGNAIAQSRLGYMYEYGNGVARNVAEAVKWYRKAAEQGFANSPFHP